MAGFFLTFVLEIFAKFFERLANNFGIFVLDEFALQLLQHLKNLTDAIPFSPQPLGRVEHAILAALDVARLETSAALLFGLPQRSLKNFRKWMGHRPSIVSPFPFQKIQYYAGQKQTWEVAMSETMTKEQRAEARKVLVESLKLALHDELLETHEQDAQHRLAAILLGLVSMRMCGRFGPSSRFMIVPDSSLKRFVHIYLLREIEAFARKNPPESGKVEDEVTLILTEFLQWSIASIKGQTEHAMGHNR